MRPEGFALNESDLNRFAFFRLTITCYRNGGKWLLTISGKIVALSRKTNLGRLDRNSETKKMPGTKRREFPRLVEIRFLLFGQVNHATAASPICCSSLERPMRAPGVSPTKDADEDD